MEDLRWACMSVNLRAVRSALAPLTGHGGRRAGTSLQTRGGAEQGLATAARPPVIDLAERDPLAGSTVLHFACACLRACATARLLHGAELCCPANAR